MTTDKPAAPAEATSDGSARESALTRLLLRQETTLLIVIVVVGALAASRSSLFLTQPNLTEILRSSVIYFVMGCGAALLIIGGGFDFSPGAVFTLGALVATKLMVDSGYPWPLAVVIGLAICGAVGVANFAFITYLHVPPIISTLGTYYMLTGINNLVTDGNDVLPLPDGFQKIGQGEIAGVPTIVLIAVVVGLLFWFLLERTRFGVNVRALGGNREAAVGNGLRVVRLDLALYVIAAATACLAGLIYSARVGAGQVTAGGTSTTLIAITAVLIGGVSLMGGLGSIQGVAVGAVLLSLIDNALVLTEIPPQYNSIIIGAILVCAVAVDHLRRSRIYRKR